MAIIEVDGLRKANGGRAVVDGVDLRVEEGEIFHHRLGRVVIGRRRRVRAGHPRRLSRDTERAPP